jgi:FlaA1/EpsC-like NDP-sugar epimerase
MRRIPLIRNRWTAFAHDLVWVPVSIALAFWLRFNLEPIPTEFVHGMTLMIGVSLPVMAVSFWYFGLYRGIWRFASTQDLLRILRAVLLGAVASFALIFIGQRLADIPRSTLVLYPLILMIGLAGPRVLYRLLKEHRLSLADGGRSYALLVGAGRAGELLVRDLLRGGAYVPVGFLDDAADKQHRDIHGVPVLGRLADLAEVASRREIDVVLLAMPSAPASILRKVVEQCQKLGLPCRTLPSVREMAHGKVEVSRLRKVQIDDLLGREAIRIDDPEVRGFIEGRCVMITGAGGSIGSELCRQVAQYQPRTLVLVDHGEFNLYRIEQELAGLDPSPAFHAHLGDIRDIARMHWLFARYRPDVVLNAAAYKHVPMVEENPIEGVKTNVLGTCQLADLAVEFGAATFVQVSTDKAVNPANVMGATKRAAEIYCQNLDARAGDTAFITTRFGNVLGSAGSVVPLFEEQIGKGGPVTVTHPEITRYFMTIPEAVSLILQAGSMGKGGEIFVLDMGEPVRIVDLAEQMIRLSGLEPGRDIEVRFTGLRPGEKLYEELFHHSEDLTGTRHPKLMLAASRSMAWRDVQGHLKRLSDAVAEGDVDQLRLLLRRMIPEYEPAMPATAEAGEPAAGTVLH